MIKIFLFFFQKMLIWICLLFNLSLFSQQKLIISGKVTDGKNFEIPYAAVGITGKYIGTSTTEEGSFSFIITNKELSDTLKISSLGYETFKINMKDYLKLENKVIVLKEKFTELSEVVVLAPINYVSNAIKKLKVNTLSDTHQLNILYRRWDIEEKECRYFIEHHLKSIDKGPFSNIVKFSVDNARKSADYRLVKNEARFHPLKYMEWNNPLRKGLRVKSFKWKKTKDTNYDGEDVLVFEGLKKNNDKLVLYIGFETNRIYRVDYNFTPNTGKSQEGIWTYKKNSKGKLYLSYHTRIWKGARKLPENVKKIMLANGQKVREYYPVEFRHEAMVLNLIEDKREFDNFQQSDQKDMSLYKIPYRENFWDNISIPPKTKYYKKNIGMLEGLYGVPIETQFKYSNN